MLLAEDVIASARGLWRSEDEELEEEESTAMLPAALTDLRSMDAAAMQALQRCSEEHNALDEGVEKEAAHGRLQRAGHRLSVCCLKKRRLLPMKMLDQMTIAHRRMKNWTRSLLGKEKSSRREIEC